MSHGGRFFRVLFKAIVIVGLTWLLLIGVQESHQIKTATATTGDFKHLKLVRKERIILVDPDLHLNYMSKRRVPNGPDPIHNRRAGKSGQPPGQD